jgi:hypothetical protein
MKSFIYNDTEFSVAPAGTAWDISRRDAGGKTALVGAGLFTGLAAAEAESRALALVKSMPVARRRWSAPACSPAWRRQKRKAARWPWSSRSTRWACEQWGRTWRIRT